jgi:hypothetical protein
VLFERPRSFKSPNCETEDMASRAAVVVGVVVKDRRGVLKVALHRKEAVLLNRRKDIFQKFSMIKKKCFEIFGELFAISDALQLENTTCCDFPVLLLDTLLRYFTLLRYCPYWMLPPFDRTSLES